MDGERYCEHCGKEGADKRCSRCLSAYYCSPKCQKTAWKAGHRHKCVAPEAGDDFKGPTAAAAAVAGGAMAAVQQAEHGGASGGGGVGGGGDGGDGGVGGDGDGDECAICLERMEDPQALSGCGHRFCSGCIEGLRAHHARETRGACPLCRQEMGLTRTERAVGEAGVLVLRAEMWRVRQPEPEVMGDTAAWARLPQDEPRLHERLVGAAAEVQRCLQLNETHSSAHEMASFLCKYLGRREEALAHGERAAALATGKAAGGSARKAAQRALRSARHNALAHAQGGQLAKAREVLEAVLDKYPDQRTLVAVSAAGGPAGAHEHALHTLGNVLHELGEHDAALRAYRRLLALFPRAEQRSDGTWGDIYFNIGNAHLALAGGEAVAQFPGAPALSAEHERGAHGAYAQAARINPRDHVAAHNAGMMSERLCDHAAALREYRTAQRRGGSFPGEPELAERLRSRIAHLEAAMAGAAGGAAASRGLKDAGNGAFARGDFTEAARAYTGAIAKDASNPTLYTNRAVAYLKLGGREAHLKALQDGLMAFKLAPSGTFARAFERVGAALMELNHLVDAKSIVDAGRRRFPQSAALLALQERLCQACMGNMVRNFVHLRATVAAIPEAAQMLRESASLRHSLDTAVSRMAMETNMFGNPLSPESRAESTINMLQTAPVTDVDLGEFVRLLVNHGGDDWDIGSDPLGKFVVSFMLEPPPE